MKKMNGVRLFSVTWEVKGLCRKSDLICESY